MARASDSDLRTGESRTRGEGRAPRELKAVLVAPKRSAEQKRAARAAMSPADRAIADSYKLSRRRAAPSAVPAREAPMPRSDPSYQRACAEFWADEEGAPAARSAAPPPSERAPPSKPPSHSQPFGRGQPQARHADASESARATGRTDDATAAFRRSGSRRPQNVREVHRLLDGASAAYRK